MDTLKISLSGGGFRALLFHLGVMLALAKNRQLQSESIIVGVSGGAVLAGLLGIRRGDLIVQAGQPFPSPSAMLFCGDIKSLVQRDVRNNVMRSWLLFWVLASTLPVGAAVSVYSYVTYFSHFGGWVKCIPVILLAFSSLVFFTLYLCGSVGPSRTDLLQYEYDTLFQGHRLESLVNTYVTATSLSTGTLFIFGHSEVRQAARDDALSQVSPRPLERIATAVAASSAFPPAFPPLRFKFANDTTAIHSLTDGGVFDNLGIFALRRLVQDSESTVVICNAAPRQRADFLRSFQGSISRNVRATNILMYQVANSEPKGAFVEVGIFNQHSSESPVDDQFLDDVSRVRTDLDHFSDATIASLVWHGAMSATAALKLQSPLTKQELAECFRWSRTVDSLIDDFRDEVAARKRWWGSETVRSAAAMAFGSKICLSWIVPIAFVIMFGWSWWRAASLDCSEMRLLRNGKSLKLTVKSVPVAAKVEVELFGSNTDGREVRMPKEPIALPIRPDDGDSSRGTLIYAFDVDDPLGGLPSEYRCRLTIRTANQTLSTTRTVQVREP